TKKKFNLHRLSSIDIAWWKNSDWRTLRVSNGQRKKNAGANQAKEAADARRSCVQVAARAVLCFARRVRVEFVASIRCIRDIIPTFCGGLRGALYATGRSRSYWGRLQMTFGEAGLDTFP